MRPPISLFVLAATGTIIAACSGGSIPTSGNVQAPPSPSAGGAPQSATAHFSITLPAPGSTGSSSRKPEYISPNTQSVSILVVSVNGSPVSGQNAVAIQTYAGASNCTSAPTGLTCSGDVPAFAGNDVFSVNLFSGPNATGSVLGSGSVAQPIAAGGSSVPLNNSVSVSIGGVVANLAVSVSPDTLQIGKSATLSVTINATDASGATIVGPATYTTPVQLSTSDTTGSVGFVTASSTTPSPTLSITAPPTTPQTAIKLVYNGSSQLAAGPLNVQAQQGALTVATQVQVSGPPTPTPSALPSSTPIPVNATIYVLNRGTNNGQGARVTEYPAGATGNVAPARTLNLSSSLYAAGIAVDSTGRVYVGYYNNASFTLDPGNEIDVYAAGASGAAAPVARITSENAQSTQLDPGVLYVDKLGRMITLANTNVDMQTGGDSIVTYAANANGAVPPTHAWNFDYNNPGGSQYFVYAFQYSGWYTIGFNEDAAGNLYMGAALGKLNSPDRFQGIYVAPAAFVNGPPLTQPSREIPGGASATNIPGYGAGQLIQGIALDSSGTIYESQSIAGAGAINVFSSGASGGTTNVPPARTMTSSALNVSVPAVQVPPQLPIAIIGSNVLVANQTNNALLFFPAGSNGTVTPSTTVTGSSTQLNNPIGLAIGPGQ